jgi:hypothetical protein
MVMWALAFAGGAAFVVAACVAYALFASRRL